MAGSRLFANGQVLADAVVAGAIAAALEIAAPGDAGEIAGKGDETGQQLADRTIALDDRVGARELLRAATTDRTT